MQAVGKQTEVTKEEQEKMWEGLEGWETFQRQSKQLVGDDEEWTVRREEG